MKTDYKNMSDKDKLKLISKIWNTIKAPDLLPVPQAHKRILDKRLETDDSNSHTWSEFKELLDQLTLLRKYHEKPVWILLRL